MPEATAQAAANAGFSSCPNGPSQVGQPPSPKEASGDFSAQSWVALDRLTRGILQHSVLPRQ